LNAPLPPYASVAAGYVFEPSTAHVLYRANLDDAASLELYSAPIDGSSPATKLNRTPGPSGDVAGFVLGSGLVAYLDDEPLSATTEAFVGPSDGSTLAVRINDPFPAGTQRGSVRGFDLTPDGARSRWVGA